MCVCLTLCNPMDGSLPSSSIYGISRQEYWSGLPFLPPGDLPDSGTGPVAPASAAEFFTTKPLGKLSCATHQIFLMLYFLGTWKNCTSLPLLKLGMVT